METTENESCVLGGWIESWKWLETFSTGKNTENGKQKIRRVNMKWGRR
jgi:hypothetical protein